MRRPDAACSARARSATGAAAALLLAGCAAAPKTAFTVPEPHAALGRSVRVLTDACVQRRVLVGANHFVLDASEAVAQALDANTRGYLERRGISASGASAFSVCGVLNDPQSPDKTFAAEADGPTRKQAPPLKVSPALADATPALPSLLAELQAAAQRTLAASAADKDKVAPEQTSQLSPAAREAAAALAAPDTRLLFVGLSGNSESGGKIFAQVTAVTALSAAAMLAAPSAAVAFTGPSLAQQAAFQATSMVGVRFISVDGTLVVGALVDTSSGRIAWAHAVHSPADPLKPEVRSRGLTSDRVLATLLNQSAPQWSPPGRAASAAAPAMADSK